MSEEPTDKSQIRTEDLFLYWYTKMMDISAKKTALDKELKKINKELSAASSERDKYRTMYVSENKSSEGLTKLQYTKNNYSVGYENAGSSNEKVKIALPKKKTKK